MLWRQTITYGNHDAIGRQGNAAANTVSGVQITDDEAAAEKPHESRPRRLCIVRLEDAQRDCAIRPVDQLFGHRSHLRIAPQSQRCQAPALAQPGQRVVFGRSQTRGEVRQAQKSSSLSIRLVCAQHARHTDSLWLKVRLWFFVVVHCRSIHRNP
ncbi:hypothetical protein D3C80_1282050 [compost metagenome]